MKSETSKLKHLLSFWNFNPFKHCQAITICYAILMMSFLWLNTIVTLPSNSSKLISSHQLCLLLQMTCKKTKLVQQTARYQQAVCLHRNCGGPCAFISRVGLLPSKQWKWYTLVSTDFTGQVTYHRRDITITCVHLGDYFKYL